MFAHDKLELPAHLLPDDVSDLLAWLGYRCDRRNITRALEGAGIPGVVPPGSRAAKWTIPCQRLLDVTAAILHRRAFRAAGPARMPVRPRSDFRHEAARLLLRERELARYVPPHLRREIAAERRQTEAAAAERRRQQLAAAERRSFGAGAARRAGARRRCCSPTPSAGWRPTPPCSRCT